MQAIQVLKKDRALSLAMRGVGPISLKKDNDLYFSLLRAIVGQQLSVKAAQTIWKRFLDLFNDKYPHAWELLKIEAALLRSVGLSYQKAGYLKNIAAFSLEKSLNYGDLKKLTDEELIEYLIQIKGVGRWTAEMLLMFNLKRMDVFPKDDLGIQTGMKLIYKIRAKDKKQLYKKLDSIAENWRPYRTLACMYIWRYKDQSKVKSK
jgi:DNA-3-methyladenine glycosylase II